MTRSLKWLCSWMIWVASMVTASACQIEYSDGLVEAMRRAGHPVAKRVGNFASLQECQAALADAVARSGDPTLRQNMRCVDCPPAATDSPAPAGVDWQRQQAEQEAWAAQQAELARQQAAQAELARQARAKELARQREFERDRDELARQLKSPALQQLESVAGSSQQAAGTAAAGQLDPARPQAEFVAGPGGIPIHSVAVPEPQTPVARLKEYVVREQRVAQERRQALWREWETASESAGLASERRNRKKHQLQEVQQELAGLELAVDPPPELQAKKDSLEQEAKALLAEAEALNEQVREAGAQVQSTLQAQQAQAKRDQALRDALTAAERQPEQAEEWLRKLQEQTP